MDKPVDEMFFDLKHDEIFIKKWKLENRETHKFIYTNCSGAKCEHMPLLDLCLETVIPGSNYSNFQSLVETMYKTRQTILTNYKNKVDEYPKLDEKTVNEIFDKLVMDFINYYLKIYNIHNCEFLIGELKDNINEFNETIKKMNQENRVELVYLNLKIHELNDKINKLKKKNRGCFSWLCTKIQFKYQPQV